MSKPLTPSQIEAAIYGPLCRKCTRMRTRNPSETCTPCLGSKACMLCHGRGQRLVGRHSGPVGCSGCSGTGLIAR